MKIAMTTLTPSDTYPLDIRVAPNGSTCIENDYFEPHQRGKNWVATVTYNPASKYELDRVFWEKGAPRFYVSPALIRVGDVIEFAGDYRTYGGKRHPDRVYRLVVAVQPDKIKVADVQKPGARSTNAAGRVIYEFINEPDSQPATPQDVVASTGEVRPSIPVLPSAQPEQLTVAAADHSGGIDQVAGVQPCNQEADLIEVRQ